LKDFVEDFMLLTNPKELIASIGTSEQWKIGLTLKAEARAALNTHLGLLHRNLAFKMQEARI
jgi:hypothetical protein